MNPRRRVVITGSGLITPIAIGTQQSWDGALQGRSGVGKITRYHRPEAAVKIAAEVKGFKAEDFMERKEARRMDLFAQFALAAAELAMQDAAPPIGKEKPNGYDPEKVGVIVGSGIGGLGSFEETHSHGLAKGFDRLSPFFILKMIINMAPGRISMRFNCRGANWSPVSACSTSANAIGEAYRQIQWGILDAAIAGGSEATITAVGIGGFEAMRALSLNNDDPEHASRPFDRDRDGFVMGEGAGIVVLEELAAAQKRGARILGEVVGYATNSDAYHETLPAPEHEGAQRCMRAALHSAGLEAKDIQYINAHGTSTPANDLNESKAISRVFGEHASKVLVSSTKSVTGHMLGASGGVEAVFTALAIRDGMVPPTMNYRTPDPELEPLDFVPNEARRAALTHGLSNSFGFGGTNACLVLKKFED